MEQNEQSGKEWNIIECNGIEWNGTECNGIDRSRMEQNIMEQYRIDQNRLSWKGWNWTCSDWNREQKTQDFLLFF